MWRKVAKAAAAAKVDEKRKKTLQKYECGLKPSTYWRLKRGQCLREACGDQGQADVNERAFSSEKIWGGTGRDTLLSQGRRKKSTTAHLDGVAVNDGEKTGGKGQRPE